MVVERDDQREPDDRAVHDPRHVSRAEVSLSTGAHTREGSSCPPLPVPHPPGVIADSPPGRPPAAWRARQPGRVAALVVSRGPAPGRSWAHPSGMRGPASLAVAGSAWTRLVARREVCHAEVSVTARDVLLLAVWIAAPASSAAAFGTIDSGGQHREHERITRAALSCAGETSAHEDCFEPGSMDVLAGHDREFGAVGAPDSDEISDPCAHCDNADYLEGDYPRTRELATSGLLACLDHVRMRFGEGAQDARDLLDDEGHVIEGEVDIAVECRVFEAAENRAKCSTLEAFGVCCTECRTSTHTATGRTSPILPAPSVGQPARAGPHRTESVVRSPYGDVSRGARRPRDRLLRAPGRDRRCR